MSPWIPDSPPTFADYVAVLPGPFPVLPVLAAVLAVAYLAGAIRLWRQGRRWPVWRTVSFLLGCVLLAGTTGLGVEAYGYALLSVFMFQQLTLMMAIPPLLVLGSPGTLLLRATPHRGMGQGSSPNGTRRLAEPCSQVGAQPVAGPADLSCGVLRSVPGRPR